MKNKNTRTERYLCSLFTGVSDLLLFIQTPSSLPFLHNVDDFKIKPVFYCSR